jgi:alkylhydroperoxidase family enzyme
MENTIPFLPTIEKPGSLVMKLVYYLTKRQFGKVLTPVKVGSARLPVAFGMFYGKTYELDKKLKLPKETAFLIRHLVALINVCEYCIDIGRFKAMKELMNEEKIDAVGAYKISPLFTDAEKSALDYATELTKDKKVRQETFSQLRIYYSERQVCEIAFLVASEHLINLTNIGLNIHSDMFCDLSKRNRTKND